MKFNFLRTTGTILCLASLLFPAKINAQYCIPAPIHGCSSGDYPSQFALTGTTISINDPTLGCTGGYYGFGGYQDLTATDTCAVSSPSVDNGTITGDGYTTFSYSSSFFYSPLSSYYYYSGIYYSYFGGSYPYTYSSPDPDSENMEIYVDFNNDDIFDSSESVGGLNPVTAYSPAAFSITIPSGVAAGFYRMRLVFTSVSNGAYTPGGGSYIDPCLMVAGMYPYESGEAIDYTLQVGTIPTCPPPTGLTVIGITTTSGVENWTEPGGSDGSEYVVTTVPGTPTGSGTQTTALSNTSTGLTPATVYYVYVRDSCGPGDFSAWVTTTFTTSATLAICNPPTSLTLGTITSTTGTINWTEPAGTTGSEYVVTTTPGTPPGSGTPTTALTYTATGLTPGTLYYASVRDSCGPGDFSAWVTITFTTGPCPVPTSLSLGGETSTTATINWTEPAGSVGSQYVITTVLGTPAGSGANTTGLTYTATGLTPSTTYYVYVRDSCGPDNFSTWVTLTFTTLEPPCNPPTGLSVTGITSSTATVGWSEPAGSDGSEYVVTTIPGTPAGSGTQTSALTETSTGLTGSTVYYVYVRDSCGPGDFSPWVTLTFTTTPTPPGPCDVPYSFMASIISNTSATLSWLEPAGSNGSEYVVSTVYGTPTGSGTATTASTINLTGLTPVTPYYASLRDSCGPGDVSAWVAITFTTTASALSVSNVGSSTDFNITTFPNPVKEMLTVQINGAIGGGVGHIQLMDIAGKLIKTVDVTTNTLNIPMNGLPAGIYFIRYTDALRTKTIKITTIQ